MTLQQMTDNELIERKNKLLNEINSLPSYSLHRRDLYKALDRIEKERVRREWKKQKLI